MVLGHRITQLLTTGSRVDRDDLATRDRSRFRALDRQMDILTSNGSNCGASLWRSIRQQLLLLDEQLVDHDGLLVILSGLLLVMITLLGLASQSQLRLLLVSNLRKIEVLFDDLQFSSLVLEGDIWPLNFLDLFDNFSDDIELGGCVVRRCLDRLFVKRVFNFLPLCA